MPTGDQRRRLVDAHVHALAVAPELVPDDRVAHREQHDAHGQEDPGVPRREAQADRWARQVHQITRYPVPMTVSITGGWPSLRRRFMSVTRTVFVNGSGCSSHTRSSRVSALTTAPSARSVTSRTPNSLGLSEIGRPSRVASR